MVFIIFLVVVFDFSQIVFLEGVIFILVVFIFILVVFWIFRENVLFGWFFGRVVSKSTWRTLLILVMWEHGSRQIQNKN